MTASKFLIIDYKQISHWLVIFGSIYTISFCVGLCVGSKPAGRASANEGTAGSEPDGL